MRIYLGDLSHDTVGLATEVFPLNIGYIAAYAKKVFGDSIEIRLFKYIPDLENAIERDPPDVLALSNYPWCHNIDLALFHQLSRRRPDALCIMGGPNFPHSSDEQAVFLASRPLVDAYVYLDGEVGFSNLLTLVQTIGSTVEARRSLRGTPVDGCVQLRAEGGLVARAKPIRIQDLDEVPSPYLMGLLDPFFDGRLSPMIQTHRGCPFRCTYCADGSELVNKVNQFSTERVCSEIRYIAERAPKTVRSLHIADLNFGMFKRDAEICDTIADVMHRYNYPLYVETATGKNSKERIIGAIQKLEGALNLVMSVQSMTPDVLRNIKRDNIRLNDFLALKPAIKMSKLPTFSEIILGLPGETKASHFDSLDQLMMSEIDRITPYTLMMLNGSELATPEQRRMWGFKTKYRVLPRDFTKLKNGEKVVEIEEVVVASNTLDFEDYVECRKMAFLISVLHTTGFKAVLKLLIQNSVRPVDVFARIASHVDQLVAQRDSRDAVRLMRDFERETREELWDSEEELREFFDDNDNFQGLIEGRYGANLIHTYRARAVADCFEQFAEFLFSEANAILAEKDVSEMISEMMRQAQIFSLGIIHNLLGDDRLTTTPEMELGYDFESWISDPDGRPLPDFAWLARRLVRFVLSHEQHRLVEDSLDKFGHHDLGKGKVLIRINPNTLWRRPVVEEKAVASVSCTCLPASVADNQFIR